MTSPGLGLVVLVLAAIESFLATRRVTAIMRSSAVSAANWDAALGAFLGVSVLILTVSGWYLLPMVCGYWLGTYVAKSWA